MTVCRARWEIEEIFDGRCQWHTLNEYSYASIVYVLTVLNRFASLKPWRFRSANYVYLVAKLENENDNKISSWRDIDAKIACNSHKWHHSFLYQIIYRLTWFGWIHPIRTKINGSFGVLVKTIFSSSFPMFCWRFNAQYMPWN